ncbi:hypothetical protein HNR23_000121 [Nocardiopsis mwathae]|uniref:DUF4276 family protein n=1 Tax=Nocardiopsis mwathae TaxID=1472723 RepID=A0A7X0D3T0_9ACTN|nr:hypothetical protein [Nocardiopsis mwathae]
MRRLHILCEGQTEETVVRETIAPYLEARGVYATHSILTTRRAAGGSAFKGGVSKWSKIQVEIRLLLKDSSLGLVTTFIDYYGAPPDTPGMADRPSATPHDQVVHVERAMAEAIGDSRFLPHLLLHETETWVLACPEALGIVTGDQRIAAAVSALTAEEGGAELVNDGPNTAPSKRLQALYPKYRKTADGPDAIYLTGIDAIRERCSHADQWFDAIQRRLGGPSRYRLA